MVSNAHKGTVCRSDDYTAFTAAIRNQRHGFVGLLKGNVFEGKCRTLTTNIIFESMENDTLISCGCDISDDSKRRFVLHDISSAKRHAMNLENVTLVETARN